MNNATFEITVNPTEKQILEMLNNSGSDEEIAKIIIDVLEDNLKIYELVEKWFALLPD